MHPIDVRDLLGNPGASRGAALHDTIDGLSTELAGVPPDRPIDGDLLLESVVEGILASGQLSGSMRMRCARCLKEFDRTFEVEVTELFVRAPDPDADDYPLEPDGGLDPEQMVRDAVGLELPFSPLCRPDCRGLCPICGGDRNLDECPGHVETDPRWEALEGLFTDE